MRSVLNLWFALLISSRSSYKCIDRIVKGNSSWNASYEYFCLYEKHSIFLWKHSYDFTIHIRNALLVEEIIVIEISLASMAWAVWRIYCFCACGVNYVITSLIGNVYSYMVMKRWPTGILCLDEWKHYMIKE
jgi:hypothetical protein